MKYKILSNSYVIYANSKKVLNEISGKIVNWNNFINRDYYFDDKNNKYLVFINHKDKTVKLVWRINKNVYTL